MKALVVKQPWASLIADGRKTLEVRTWSTSYRGPVLIVAARNPKIEPCGMAVALAWLNDCRPMVSGDLTAAMVSRLPGRYVFELTDVSKLEPIPMKGAQGLYNV